MIFLVIFFAALAAGATFIAVRFARRCLQMQKSLDIIDGNVQVLEEYCNELKDKSLIYLTPEVMKFHRLVLKIAKSIDENVKVEVENG